MRIFNNIAVKLLAAVLASGLTGYASADLNVWYHDSNGNFDYGDIADGNTVLNPPAYACGRRFPLASYYRWMGSDGDFYGNISDGNFNKDVRVWIPKAGCPYTNEIVVEYTDGSHTFNPPVGRHYLEVNTNYASHWINADGVRPACSNCVIPNPAYQVEKPDWGKLVDVFSLLKQTADKPKSATFAALFDQTEKAIASLAKRFDDDAAEFAWRADDQRFDTVNELGGRVHASLDDAAELLQQCGRYQQRGRMTAEAYRSCDLAAQKIAQAGSDWSTLVGELEAR